MATNAERWALKLLTELPADPRDLLRPRKHKQRFYATPKFLSLFFEWLDQRIFDDPQAALRWAEVAPELAAMVESPEGHQANREKLVRGYAMLGSAYRAVSRHGEADVQYRNALDIAEAEPIGPEVSAELLRRLANLRDCQGKPKAALEMLDTALETSDEPCLGRWNVLACRARVLTRLGRNSEAIEDCGQVLEQIKVKGPAEKRTHYAAGSALAYALRGAGSAASCWLALEYVGKAKQVAPRSSPAMYHLEWIEGSIWARLQVRGVRTGYCLAQEAENALLRAFYGFQKLRLPWEITLVGLDLTQFYRDLDRWKTARKIALEALKRFEILSGEGRALKALEQVVCAARSRQGLEAAIAGVRQMVRPLQPSKLTRARTGVPPLAPPAARPINTLDLVANRKRLLGAAYREIRFGFQVKHIAKGFGNDALYRHFGDRAGAAVAVVDEHVRGLVTAWLTGIEAANPLASIAGQEPPLLAVPAQEYLEQVEEPLEDVYRQWRVALAQILRRGQEERLVRSDIDADSAAGMLLAVLRSPEPRDPEVLHTACAALAEFQPPSSPGAWTRTFSPSG